MSAGFLKRALSSLVDLALVFAVVTAVFFIGGRTLLQNRIENYDVIDAEYQEVRTARDEDLAVIYADYQAALELAGDDETAKTAAATEYAVAQALIDAQFSADIAPFNDVLTGYYMTIIYFYSIGILILMGIYTLATGSKTLGRRLMQIQLSGPVNPLSIFFHDIILKYFFTIIVFSVSPFAGAILLALSLLIDVILMSFTKRRATFRDLMLKMQVVKTGYGY
ncbi:MAG: RDD family protein [Candidatus Izemoplasmatales bacterium]